MKAFSLAWVTAIAIAAGEAVASDLVTPDCRYVGPPVSAERRHQLTLACVRARPRSQSVLDLLLADDPPPPRVRPPARPLDPQPVLDLSTGRLLLIVPVTP